MSVLRQKDGQPFRAVVVQHDWRGSKGLCIGAEGYDRDSFVVLMCDEETKARFPVGTLFDLVPVEKDNPKKKERAVWTP